MTRPSGPYHRAFRRVKTNSPPKPLLKHPSSGCPLCKDRLGSLRALSLSMIVSFPPDANYFFNRLRWPHSHLCLGISVLAYFQYISLPVIVTFLNEAETLNFLISVSKTLMFGALTTQYEPPREKSRILMIILCPHIFSLSALSTAFTFPSANKLSFESLL